MSSVLLFDKDGFLALVAPLAFVAVGQGGR